MRRRTPHFSTGFRLLLAALLLCAPVLGACGPTTLMLTGTDRVAGADGELIIEDISGGNKLVTIELEHVPPPGRLGDGLTTYIMWFVPSGQAPAMASVLEFDEDDRIAIGTATTPAAEFEVLVTAEQDRTVAAPSDVVIARRSVE